MPQEDISFLPSVQKKEDISFLPSVKTQGEDMSFLPSVIAKAKNMPLMGQGVLPQTKYGGILELWDRQ